MTDEMYRRWDSPKNNQLSELKFKEEYYGDKQYIIFHNYKFTIQSFLRIRRAVCYC